MSVTHRPRAQLVAAGLALLAAGLIVAAIFLPYQVVTGGGFIEEGFEVRFEVGLWGSAVSDGAIGPDLHPKFGVVFAAVAALLAVGGCVALFARRIGSRPTVRLLLFAGASAAVAAVAMLVLVAAPLLGWFGQGYPVGIDFDPEAGPGLWLLVGAAAVAVVAAGLVVRRGEPDHVEQSGVPPLRQDEAVIRWVPGEPDPDLR